MHLGSIYLIVNDFEKSICFYEKLLEMPVSSQNMSRFAQFSFDSQNISLLNGHFDKENPDKVVQKGQYSDLFDDFQSKALAPNTNKFVFNFWVDNLQDEYERISKLDITDNISKIKYVCNVSPYYYFIFTDPDMNLIEVTGNYTPEDGEFDE